MKKFYTTKKVIMLLIMAMTATSVLQAQTMKVKKIVSEAKDEKKEVYEDVNLQRDRNPVTDLELERKENNAVLLTWNYPEGFIPKERATLSWSGDFSSMVAAGQSEGDIAHRYEVSDLQDYIGWKVKYIGIVPISDGHYHSVRIWEGPEGDSLEQVADNLTLIYEKLAENLSYNVRNYIPIDSEITIEEGKEFWFGIRTVPIYMTFQYTWPIDGGPVVSEKGDLYRYVDGYYEYEWESLLLYGGINSNFCIEVILENSDGKMVKMGYGNGDDETEELEGYEIYADEEQIAVITDPHFLEYEDYRFVRGEVNYCVEAVYTTGNAEAVCGSIEILTVEEGDADGGEIRIYPNPARESFKIRYEKGDSEGKPEIRITDMMGRTIKRVEMEVDGEMMIGTEDMPSGMYFYTISIGEKSRSGKLIISR